MSDAFDSSVIPGVRLGSIERHADERGSFREIWRQDASGRIDAADAGAPPGTEPRFVQANVSSSARGVLRGLHLHRRQFDHWVVAGGRAFVALVDVRPMIDGAERPVVLTVEAPEDTWIDIPVGVAHGFLALDDLEMIYFVTNLYDGRDELGFAWDDRLAAVPWPAVQGTTDGRPILSERDRSNPPLADLVDRLRSER